MKIVIYGSGCPNCQRVEALVRTTASSLGIDAEIEKVSNLQAIAAAGVLGTPAVSIDGVVKVAGRVPTAREVEAWLTG